MACTRICFASAQFLCSSRDNIGRTQRSVMMRRKGGRRTEPFISSLCVWLLVLASLCAIGKSGHKAFVQGVRNL
eukprot:5824602-Amphidinium_carterae.1